jgi:hypothetical protein
LNFDTGASVLVACDGEWRTGGEYRVFYLAPAGVISELSRDLWRMKRQFPADSEEWQPIKAGCVDYLMSLLNAQDVNQAVPDATRPR